MEIGKGAWKERIETNRHERNKKRYFLTKYEKKGMAKTRIIQHEQIHRREA
jgi:hypothetical protein